MWIGRTPWIVVDGESREGWLMTTMSVSGWMFLLVPAHPGCPRQNPHSHKTVVCVCLCVWMFLHPSISVEWHDVMSAENSLLKTWWNKIVPDQKRPSCYLNKKNSKTECRAQPAEQAVEYWCTELDWIEQGLTSHQTHYRLYRGRVFMGQMTQPTVSKHWRKIGPKD